MSPSIAHAGGHAGPLIALDDVSQEFDGGRIVALRHLSLAVEPGEAVGIVGPSGSGKSTIVHTMCGIRRPSSGRVLWDGEPISSPRRWTEIRRSRIGIVFQDFNLFTTLSAAENAEMALFGSGLGAAERRERVRAALAAVGLAPRATHLPHELSGGERQRVAIARSIVNHPTLLIADEPTGNLDSVNSDAIMDLLFELQQAHSATLVIVTHDPAHAGRCSRVVEIRDGSVAAQSPRKMAQRARLP
jgi:putative ABC transport system ATP-binding protein